ncbi:MAG TPA: outer membrane protein assembly factor BamD [Vicinamibacterales bacterium]|nr:outer membrane protein assembly factor BamD [Vicinamibacterales bacterium]
MRLRSFVALLGVILLAAASPAAAANKEHQQMMADLRMLQEQSQLLQNLIGSVTEALKAVNTRLDQTAEINRKAFADQKLVIDNLTNDVRVIREKLDDNNVRIGSLTQEVDSLRQSVQQMGSRPSTTNNDADPAASSPASGGAAPPPGGSSAPAVGQSPQKLFDSALGDYYSGQYDLAIIGFNEYIKSYPKSDQADDAQVYICTAYLQDGKNDKAVEACDLAIRTYPAGDKIPDAYYKKGLALQNLRDLNGARDAWEHVVKANPDTDAGRLAKQGLERIKRPN